MEIGKLYKIILNGGILINNLHLQKDTVFMLLSTGPAIGCVEFTILYKGDIVKSIVSPGDFVIWSEKIS